MSPRRRPPSAAPPLALRWDRRGIRLTDGALAFEGAGEAGATFIGHALSGPGRGGQRVITSDLTARLLGGRLGTALATPFRRRFSLGPLELELLPTGFLPGSAALFTGLGDYAMLYAGEVGQGASLYGLPPAAPRQCDHLVLRPSHGDPRYDLPPPGETQEQIVAFAAAASARGLAVVLHGRPLGCLQALIGPLQAAGLAVRAHRQVHRYLGPLRAAGIALGPVPRFEGGAVPGEVILWPVEATPQLGGRGAPRLARALVGSAALFPERVAEAGCAAGFALGCRADFQALEHYVVACRPGRVTFLEIPAAPLAAALAARGIQVDVLGPPVQLSMFAEAAGGAAHSRAS